MTIHHNRGLKKFALLPRLKVVFCTAVYKVRPYLDTDVTDVTSQCTYTMHGASLVQSAATLTVVAATVNVLSRKKRAVLYVGLSGGGI
jgi:hypothetical protein